MELFSRLIIRLEDAKEPEDKIRALSAYFETVSDENAAWALKLLLERPAKRLLPARRLRDAAFHASDLPEWLFEQSLSDVGDLAEAASLLLAAPIQGSTIGIRLAQWMDERVLPLAARDAEQQTALLIESWSMISTDARFVFNKLVLGLLRPSATREQVIQGFARHRRIPAWAVHLRLRDPWPPTQGFYSRLSSSILTDVAMHRPYRLCAATDSGFVVSDGDWQAEWKWDGVRVQAIRRSGGTSIWSKSEVLLSDRFPEICEGMNYLPDGTVLDGIIVAWSKDKPGPVSVVASRLDRNSTSKRGEPGHEMVLIVFDILEFNGEDVRIRPLCERRSLLERLRESVTAPLFFGISHPGLLQLSYSILTTLGVLANECSKRLDEAKTGGADGLILKRLDSSYALSAEEDSWRVLKSESKTLNGVLMYVERGGSGRILQVTIGVWNEDQLVPVAKVPSAFAADEIIALEAFVKENTLERFGPVRTVRPAIIIEIAFDGIEPAPRRKAGFALRTPRMLRICANLDPASVASLETVKSLVP